MITLDADAQHDPEDIRRFLPLLEPGGRTLVAGTRDLSVPNVPVRSRIGRALSDFCFFIETGKRISDSQSGFRAYPLKYVSRIRCASLHYDFETELLTRCMWAGLDLAEIPISTRYDPPGKRVTHFRPFRDNGRMVLLHARLVFRRIFPSGEEKDLRDGGRAPSPAPDGAEPRTGSLPS